MLQKIITPPLCDACSTPMRLIKAGVSQKTSKPYSAFWSCPHNQSCGGKTLHFEEPKSDIPVIKEPIEYPTIQTKTEQPKSQQQITIDLLFDELRMINEKLDIITKEVIPQE